MGYGLFLKTVNEYVCIYCDDKYLIYADYNGNGCIKLYDKYMLIRELVGNVIIKKQVNE